MSNEIYSGNYGSMHIRMEDRRLWQCYESSDYEFIGVTDEFGNIIQVGSSKNVRGY